MIHFILKKSPVIISIVCLLLQSIFSLDTVLYCYFQIRWLWDKDSSHKHNSNYMACFTFSFKGRNL